VNYRFRIPCAVRRTRMEEIRNHRLVRNTVLLLLVLLIPVVPFLLFGDESEAWFTHHVLDSPWLSENGWQAALAVTGALMADILLPVPSSAVMTFAGAKFGSILGTLINWIGLSLSCALGYGIGLLCGLPLLSRFSRADELAETTRWINRFGHWILAGFRGLPVLAEASVLLAGVYRMPAVRFLAPVLLANFAIASLYAVVGSVAGAEGRLGFAILLSIIVPLLFLLAWLLLARRWLNRSE